MTKLEGSHTGNGEVWVTVVASERWTKTVWFISHLSWISKDDHLSAWIPRFLCTPLMYLSTYSLNIYVSGENLFHSRHWAEHVPGFTRGELCNCDLLVVCTEPILEKQLMWWSWGSFLTSCLPKDITPEVIYITSIHILWVRTSHMATPICWAMYLHSMPS